jgi:hypothetical protein
MHRFSSVICRLISVDMSTGYGTGGLLSMSQRTPLCSLLRLRDASKSRVQFPKSQYSGSKQHGILGVTLDAQSTWSAHVKLEGKEAAQRLGLLGPLLNRRSGLSVRNSVLLHKQLIRPMMGHACPIWWSAARSQVRKLQALQSKCPRIATNAPCYVSNRQIHDDL